MNNLLLFLILTLSIIGLYIVLIYFSKTRVIVRKNLNFDNVLKLYADKKYFLAEKSFLLLSNLQESNISNQDKASFYIKLAYIYCNVESLGLTEGLGVKLNKQKALNYIMQASKLGNPDGSYYLGYLNEFELGEPDFQKAMEYYQLADSQGAINYPDFFKFDIGRLYLQGKGVNRDIKMALELLEKSANSGRKNAQSLLGDMYYLGDAFDENIKIKQNIELGIEFYEKAAKNGHEHAIDQLKKITKIKKSKKEPQA